MSGFQKRMLSPPVLASVASRDLPMPSHSGRSPNPFAICLRQRMKASLSGVFLLRRLEQRRNQTVRRVFLRFKRRLQLQRGVGLARLRADGRKLELRKQLYQLGQIEPRVEMLHR